MNHRWLFSLQKDNWGILLVIEDGGGGWTQPMLLSCHMLWSSLSSSSSCYSRFGLELEEWVSTNMLLVIIPWWEMERWSILESWWSSLIGTVMHCPEMGGLLTRLTVCCLQSSCSGQWWLLNLYSGWCRIDGSFLFILHRWLFMALSMY